MFPSNEYELKPVKEILSRVGIDRNYLAYLQRPENGFPGPDIESLGHARGKRGNFPNMFEDVLREIKESREELGLTAAQAVKRSLGRARNRMHGSHVWNTKYVDVSYYYCGHKAEIEREKTRLNDVIGDGLNYKKNRELFNEIGDNIARLQKALSWHGIFSEFPELNPSNIEMKPDDFQPEIIYGNPDVYEKNIYSIYKILNHCFPDDAQTEIAARILAVVESEKTFMEKHILIRELRKSLRE